MPVNIAELVTLFIVIVDGSLILKFTRDLARLRQSLPRSEGFAAQERALTVGRLAMGASLVTLPVVIWIIALTAAPELLKPLF